MTEPSAAREAIAAAEANALRLALYQLTGDDELVDMPLAETPVRGGAAHAKALLPEDAAVVRARALAYLETHDGQPWPDVPDVSTLTRLIRLFVGEHWEGNLLDLAIEELAFPDFPRAVEWTEGPVDHAPEGFRVVVIGAGVSGIAAAVQLKRLGIDFVVVDRLSGIGGTWLLNDYPDIRVDIPSELFQYTFTKGYKWENHFATGSETRRYLEFVVEEFGLEEHLVLGTAVDAASWDEESATWKLTLTEGPDRRDMTANVIISAAGLFSTPKTDIAGAENFTGRIFHTTNWNHEYDWRGKRVAIIGNGSSGAQLMPAVAAEAGHVTVYQRNPQWIGPMANLKEPMPTGRHWLNEHFPYYWNWSRLGGITALLSSQALSVADQEWQTLNVDVPGGVNERNEKLRTFLTDYVAEQVDHRADLLEKLIPQYPPMVRRLVVDNGWYSALLRDNVELEVMPIKGFTEDSIVTVDGREREVDMVVMASGFATSKFLWPADYNGRDGAKLDELWEKDGPRAYLSLAMPRFPNLLTLYGPNSQPRAGGGHHTTAEAWAHYATQLVVSMLAGGHRSFEVRLEAFEAYNVALDDSMKRLIWLMEGRSYFVNEHGRVVTNVPWDAEDYRAMLRDPQLSDFDFH